MKRALLFLCINFMLLTSNAQVTIENNSELIKDALIEITPYLEYFQSNCIVNKDASDCINDLISKSNNKYQDYLIAGALYNIDAQKSYELHKSALAKKPNELNFNLEFAIESHRIEDYETAINHYEIYKESMGYL